jgi:hypothetical protein
MTLANDPQSIATPVDERAARLTGYAPVLAAGLVLALVPLVLGGDAFFVRLATLMLAYTGYAIGFNVIFGGTGQLFLCMGALAGLSGYTAGILGNDLDLPMLPATAVGVVLAGAVGALFSWVSVRRRLDAIFIGIVTLAFSLVFTSTVQATRDLTGGETGARHQVRLHTCDVAAGEEDVGADDLGGVAGADADQFRRREPQPECRHNHDEDDETRQPFEDGKSNPHVLSPKFQSTIAIRAGGGSPNYASFDFFAGDPPVSRLLHRQLRFFRSCPGTES